LIALEGQAACEPRRFNAPGPIFCSCWAGFYTDIVKENFMKFQMMLLMVMIPFSVMAADTDDRILRKGAGSEPEYPHEKIIQEEREAGYERAYQKGLIDSQSVEDVSPNESFRKGYSDAVKDGM
jgi:hypothetical protein